MRGAFTILETLVATALTAVLLLAVFHVIGSLGQSRIVLAKQPDTGAWRSDFLDTLRRDLTNATAIDFHRDGITLTGHGALRQTTLEVSHEPVTVTYALVNIHGRGWLVRSQFPRDGQSNDSGWTELLCANVRSFAVRSASPIANGATDGAAIPPVVSVSVEGPTGPMIEEKLVLR